MNNLIEKDYIDLSEEHKYLTHYVDNHPAHNEMTKECFILDILYGVGISIDHEKYSFHNGFDVFKKDLIELLSKNN